MHHEHVGTTQRPAPSRAAPRLERLEVLWRIQAPRSGRVYECVLYRTDAGLELRMQRNEDDVLRTELLAPGGADRDDVSEAWKAATVAKGFIEVPNE